MNVFVDFKEIRQDMFYNYANAHTKKRNIDLQLINQLRKESTEEENSLAKNVGRKAKNQIITQVSFALADLKRIDEFLSQSNTEDIDKITIGNITGCFIHDIMVCFGMIDDKTGKYGKSETYHYPANLIRNKLISTTPDFQMHLRKKRLSDLKSKLSSI